MHYSPLSLHPMVTRSRSHSCSLPGPRTPSTAPVLSRTCSPVPVDGLVQSGSSTPTRQQRLFQYVKRTGPSIRNRVVKVKNLAVGPRFGKTKACGVKNCKCCQTCSDRKSNKYNGCKVRTAAATCMTYNIVYLVVCSICGKHYVGRSTRSLRERLGEHRRHYYRACKTKNPPNMPVEDEQALGMHLVEHGFSDDSMFDKRYKACVLEVCSPKVLEVKEHTYIHKLNSLRPNGLNVSNPFCIPLLYK